MTRPPSGERLDRAKELLLLAGERAPGDATEFVRAQCDDDPELRDYVLELLASSTARTQMRGPSSFDGVRRLASDFVQSQRPERVGRYRILDTLGEGGMGTVYRAEQTEPVRREVALKLVKLGFDSAAVVARFEHERQALAMMEHDGIAKVHDCGTSERGQPFFVMELVRGEPITDWCDRRSLPLPERLRLLQQVCDAVQHAHQKGVVHRDLKPSNVLVAEADGRPQVKIIDFGLAKALRHDPRQAPLLTDPGQIVGTVEYMAPEQADPGNPDVDTRADVYSLGVVLYELIVGSLPFRDSGLRSLGAAELQRVIHEVDPPRPSQRLLALPEPERQRVAQTRGRSSSALAHELRRDLDWVCVRAMEKHRSRRYESAAALAAELQRFLAHEPLVAGPPSATYLLRKFVARNKGRVLAVAAVLLTAVIGALVALDFALSATALAAEKSDLAQKEAEAKSLAAATADQLADKVREFDLLSGIVLLDEAVEREAALGPPWPEHADAMQRWLDEDCRRVLALRPEVDRVLGDLRARSLPRSREARARDRASHPRSAEYTRLTQFVAAFERAERVRQGAPVPEVLPLAHWQAVDDNTLARMAWARTAPLLEQRTILGEEVQGAAMLEALRARRAESFGPNREIQYGYARLAIGDDEGARAAADRAVEAAAAGPDRELEARVIEHHDELLGAVNGVTVELRRLHDECEQLDRILDEQRTFEFVAEADRFLHDTLVRLRVDLQAFDTLQRGRVERRLRFARAIGAATAAHPGAGASWAEVKQVLAREGIELPADGIPGLVPIGVNPATGRHEFYHLGSAWDGEQDLAALPVPRHAADGTIPVDDATGIVFVLVPGGRATIGAQRSDPAGAHFDPEAQWYAEPLHQVALDPFLIARHELTQGQWARLWEGDDEGRWPSQYRAGAWLPLPKERITASHPVTQVDWHTAVDVLRRHGLELPTEVQWEYAARAGTGTPFACAMAELPRCANLADARAKAVKAEWTHFEPWDDGFVVTAPVGRFAANAFGLHDVVGNVQEWCADAFDSYERSARRGDGLRDADPGDKRVCRGGSHIDRAALAKSWMRTPFATTLRAGNLGVRPVQRLPR